MEELVEELVLVKMFCGILDWLEVYENILCELSEFDDVLVLEVNTVMQDVFIGCYVF